MTLALVPGQNVVLQHRILTFTATADIALDVSALVVGPKRMALSTDDFVFYNQPQAPGVRLDGDRAAVNLKEVAAGAEGVLCIASADTPGAPMQKLEATLCDEAGAVVVTFAVPLQGLQSAVICLELYRRGADWKVRAVGQGYSGGLAQFLVVHGVEVDDEPAAPAAPTRPAALTPDHAIEIQPLDRDRPLERVWMIFEDAARSTATLASARGFALDRLDREMSDAVADPAMRNSRAGDAARTAAQRRHDDVITNADAAYQKDAVHLITELHAIDAELPPSMASWQSPAWQSGRREPFPSNGIRLGQVTAPESGLLSVPFCVPVPLRRPLWIDTTSPAAAAPVVTAILLRLLVATATPPILDVVDLTGSLHSITGPLKPLMRDAPVTSHHDLSAKLAQLFNDVDLALVAKDKGFGVEEAPARVLVLSDFGHGMTVDDLKNVAVLAGRGSEAKVSMIIVGEDPSNSSDDQLLSALAEHCHKVRTVAGDTRIVDPWTKHEWEFTADCVPQDAAQVTRFMASVLG